MIIDLVPEVNVRSAFRIVGGMAVQIPPSEIKADMIIFMFEPNGDPIATENGTRFFKVLKDAKKDKDGVYGFEFEESEEPADEIHIDKEGR